MCMNMKICALTATINELVAFLKQINGQYMDQSQMMMSALMGYSGEWRQEGAICKDIHLQKQTQVLTSKLETVNLAENTW